ncbi:hypothetical protein EVAR_70970_1, partial [Eumeta japonica]
MFQISVLLELSGRMETLLEGRPREPRSILSSIYDLSGIGIPNLQRREGPWLCYRIALRAPPEGAVAYQQTVLEIPGRVVAVKLRHDAHLSASSHLFGMPGLWKQGVLCIFHYNISSKLLPVIGKYARHGGVTWFIHTLWIWSTVRLGPRG